MDTALKKDIYERFVPVWSGQVSRDFTAESIVPDAMPDVGAVVDADGVITLRSKETEVGAVALAASVSVSVMYAPEGGGPMESIPIAVPVELRVDAPGTDTDCQAAAKLRIRALDARMVNSRKLSVRVDVDCDAGVYRKDTLEIASGLEQEDDAVHILTQTAPMTVVADVREKTFVVTDEYVLPAGCSGAERILSQRADAAIEDVKYVSGKVVFRGRIRAGLIIAGQDGIYAGRYETEFSQIMEIGTEAADVTASVSLMFTGVYFDLPERQDGEGHIAAELHLVAQAVCREMKEMSYIADLYSNRTVLLGQPETLSVVSAARPVSMRQTVTGTAERPMGATGDVLTLCASVGSVTAEGSTVRTAVNVRIINRMEDGGCAASRCRLTAEFTPDVPAGTELKNITVTAADVYCAASGSLDVRVILQMEAMAVTSAAVTAMTAITEDADAWAALPPAPSVTLARVSPGCDMWSLAKRYRSTVAAIAAANGERETGLLLIPKAR